MWVGYNLDGSVSGVYTNPQPNDALHRGMKEVPDDHPDVVAFVTRPMPQPVDKVAVLEARIAALESKTGA